MLLTAPINMGHIEAFYFHSNSLLGERFCNEGLCMSHTVSLKNETLFLIYASMLKNWKVFAWFNRCLASLSFEIPSDLWKQHTFLLGPGVTLSAAELDIVCYNPQTEMLLHLWQIKNTASICIHRLRRSKWLQKGLVWAIWVTIVHDIIYSEIAIQESLWSFSLQLHVWVLVSEGLKLGLPPHLLPLIRWIKPPPYKFLLTAALPGLNYPQNPTGEVQWLLATNPLLHLDWL